MTALLFFALGALGFSDSRFPRATVLLKKTQSCLEFKSTLQGSEFKAECQDSDKKARAYAVTYLGRESLVKALANLRKKSDIATASPEQAFRIPR